MNDDEVLTARHQLLLALVLAGVTGDETFGDLLDAIDDYVALSIRASAGDKPRRQCGEAS